HDGLPATSFRNNYARGINMKCGTMIEGRSTALLVEGMQQRNPTPHKRGTVLGNDNAGGV
ncbi:MAG: hypothetical protein KAQ73_02940, partial [Dehalococcoidia bacterium]|nr:hypothetical protein [Dehalococcoidia bacterium]